VGRNRLTICKPVARNPGLDLKKTALRPLKKDDFVSVARRLACDEDKERFEAKLAKIAKAKPAAAK
jgi:hypothetical protein